MKPGFVSAGTDEEEEEEGREAVFEDGDRDEEASIEL